jgi:hypothetical protein
MIQRTCALLIAVMLVFLSFCGCKERGISMENTAIYKVYRAADTISFETSGWDSGDWKEVAPLDLTYYMGEKPIHIPKTQAKLMYDSNALYVIFRVEDKYIRAIDGHQGNVCRDSCVEFFFTPSEDMETGYFNLETNCGGTMLFHHQRVPRENPTVVAEEDCRRIEIFHSLPKKIETEIHVPTVWTIFYRMPFDILEKYSKVAKPQRGVVWRANFYKCADATSHPHWLTWSKVNRPKPDFHVPECFGRIEFK